MNREEIEKWEAEHPIRNAIGTMALVIAFGLVVITLLGMVIGFFLAVVSSAFHFFQPF